MAWSLLKRASVFEILGAFWAGSSATITNGYGITLSLSDLNILTADINTRLNAIEADATAVAKVEELVDAWDCISKVDIKLSGGVGDVQGVEYSSEATRTRLRTLLLGYIPVFHMVDAIKHRNGPDKSASFSMGR